MDDKKPRILKSKLASIPNKTRASKNL